ncbi:hypothetical protein GCM10010324_10780 [Streptomyces hiroshimensis]|uniref:Uncharacterized protein n=1 Tax=Streptomyces hiroshimensis TaxID=66424 RepID=A0ABQ2Y6D1_9ACTN|nr:hypothetical protein GCM10010324_10780 [Streptomyces hiroshimensis]
MRVSLFRTVMLALVEEVEKNEEIEESGQPIHRRGKAGQVPVRCWRTHCV